VILLNSFVDDEDRELFDKFLVTYDTYDLDRPELFAENTNELLTKIKELL